MLYFSSLKAKDDLLERIEDRLYPEVSLQKLASIVYQSVNVAPFIFGFVIPLDELYTGMNGYFYCISSKMPNENRLIVSPSSFSDEKACSKELSMMIRYFPLFGLSKRYLY